MFTPPALLNVYPVKSLLYLFLWGGACLSGVKSLLHLFLWGELLGIARLFNRDEIFVAFYFIGVNPVNPV